MSTSNLINSIGLFLDIVAVWVIWYYGLPEPISRSGAVCLVTEETDEVEKAKAKLYDQMARWGIGLVIVGFGLQLVSNFL